MNVLMRLLLVTTFLTGMTFLTACDKDDDDGSGPPAGNNAEGLNRGEYEMTIEGAINDTLTGDSATYVDTVDPEDSSTAVLLIYLGNETTEYLLMGGVSKKNSALVDEGTYEHSAQSYEPVFGTGAAANFRMGMDTSFFGVEGQSFTGHIQITSRSASNVMGEISDMKLYHISQQSFDSVTINGKFHAIPGEL